MSTEETTTRLLARETLPALLHSFANTFDVVIIDTPATEVAPDAKLIASHAKGCVLVARKDVTRLDGLQRLSRDVRELGATIIGTVLLDD